MNAYLRLAQDLRWQGSSGKWVTAAYASALHEEFAAVADAHKDVRSLQVFFDNMELTAFTIYPYVAELLLRNVPVSDEERALGLQSYMMTYLAQSGHIAPDYRIVPFLQRDSRQAFVLSLDDELAFPGMDWGGNNVASSPSNEHEKLRERLTACIHVLRASGTVLLDFVSEGTEILAFRSELSEPFRFSSASFRGLAGLSLVLNPQIRSDVTVAEAILHEAIHAHLYRLERPFGAFFRDRVRSRERIASPWTGSYITVDNLAQAVFVWFGLLNFWRLSNNQAAFHDVAMANVVRIVGGFERLDLTTMTDVINPAMAEAIDFIRTTVASEPAY